MVLAELGGKLRESMRKLGHGSGHHSNNTINMEQLNALLSEVSRALIESDVNVKLVMQLRNNVKDSVGQRIADAESKELSPRDVMNLRKTVQRSIVDELAALLTPNANANASDNGNGTPSVEHGHKKDRDAAPQTPNPYQTVSNRLKKGRPNVVLFVGLQGAGKTTTVAKYANHYQKRGWKVCMVCADTFRAGAFDQLKQNATRLRVPFYGSYTEADPVAIAEEGVTQFVSEGYELILVDTSGRHRQEESLLEEMREMGAAVHPRLTIFVCDGTQGQAVYDQASAFSDAVDVGGVIVTKLDGHAKGGGALSAVAATQSPVLFTGSGEHMDDLDAFVPTSFVNKLLGYGDLRGFVEEMKSVQNEKTQEELMANFAKGEFTLRDMQTQFQSILKMGPLNKVMGMIPGMPDLLSQEADGSHRRLKTFLCMMDSMRDCELDGRIKGGVDLKDDETRIHRIARGSGCTPLEVKALLQCHKQFEGVVNKVGKSGLMKGLTGGGGPGGVGGGGGKGGMLPGGIDPRALMRAGAGGGGGGGMPDMMQMMQQMAKATGGGRGGGGLPAGMPNMAAMEQMMKQMGGMPGMMGGGPGAGGMPDMATMAKMMQSMGGRAGGRR